ncbi:MAG: hypothetical protein QOD14_1448 [Solirubrobacterales bacterium]|jgi:hypothetical protein|nr:hypothetical protein [Solirubrobacterales bacterium]
MKEKRRRSFTIRLGPLGLSLVAAGITAVGFAAVSLADSGSSTGGGTGTQTFSMPAPPGGAAGATVMGGPNLSEADRKKMDEFRQCMEDNGAPGPPMRVDPSTGPPKPPTAADQQKLQKAYEACKDKLPAGMQNAGPPQIGTLGCGPPPGTPGQQRGQNQSQSNNSGTSSSGSSS